MGVIIEIIVLITAVVSLINYKLPSPTTKLELTLADYPEIFEKDVIIMISEKMQVG